MKPLRMVVLAASALLSAAGHTAGIAGSPVLLGFQVGMTEDEWRAAFSKLHQANGYTALSLGFGRVTGNGVSNEGFIFMSPATHPEYAGPTPDSWVMIFTERDGSVKALVRGETLKVPPFVDDFAAAIKGKLDAPDWVLSAVRSSQPAETDWGVAGNRKVPIKSCYATPPGYTYDAGGDFAVAFTKFRFRVGWRSLPGHANLNSVCQYIVRLGVRTNVVALDGKHVGQRVVGYSVSVFDVQAHLQAARGAESKRRDAAAREERGIRGSSSKPTF